eukprot:CAMPEP_0170180428 /NCGR_PEP_ID=MMETSP0040_2-20121228/21919_1 /TAXON_ID=641309 /ORGANISM="Lotharella oceanica, Strain CCMP622" /LENGTH=290 /DNA_ID=CAMNT_0010425057 /DNA_START=259 /DNA_END=1130 /DNA_ORIENTATION=-
MRAVAAAAATAAAAAFFFLLDGPRPKEEEKAETSTLAASLRILANVFALMTIVSGMVALRADTWSVVTVTTPLSRQFTPPTTVEFGLFSYKAYMFGDKYPEVHSYSKLPDDSKNDVKALIFAGMTTCVVSLIEVLCCLIYIVYALVRAIFMSTGGRGRGGRGNIICDSSSAFRGDWPALSEDFMLCGLALTALIAGGLAVTVWGVAGHKAQDKIEHFMLPVEVVSADTNFSISYTLAIVALVSAGVCSVLQLIISRFNCVDRESGLAGGVIPNYDTFGDGAALPMHPAPL